MRHETVRLPGLVLTDHSFELPVDHSDHDATGGELLTVFAREVCAPGREDDDLPWLLFLQGGPGFAAPRPADRSGWLGRALEDHRVLLLDQRGTGRSTRQDRHSLAGLSARQQADRLRHFRADAIVRDAEAIRRELLGERRWSVLGQSFGGFCVISYLSLAPEGLAAAYVTGGLPPLSGGPDPVYRATYRRVLDKTARYFERFPQDRARLDRIVEHLHTRGARLPSGAPLSVDRLRTLGHLLGAADGAAQLHWLLEQAFVGREPVELADPFLAAVEDLTGYRDAPLYALLHEPLYCQGEASRWSAQRVRREVEDEVGDALTFTGEMVFPWVFTEDPPLAPLAEAAELLAAYDGWPALYDPVRLAANEVPVAAAIYAEDMYVDAQASLATARAVRGLRWWLTNEYEHDGLRADARVLDRLMAMVRGDA
jgi:pimeloyl-ACP methyl ester carboxylesterase